MKKKDIHVGKNVTLSFSSIEIIQGYQYKTRKNFSKTLDIIIKEWDNLSIAINKLQKEQEKKQQGVINESKN